MALNAHTKFLIELGLLRQKAEEQAATPPPPVKYANVPGRLIGRGNGVTNVPLTRAVVNAPAGDPMYNPPPKMATPLPGPLPSVPVPDPNALYGDTGLTMAQNAALNQFATATPNSFDVPTMMRLANDPELVKASQPSNPDVTGFAGDIVQGIPGGIRSVLDTVYHPQEEAIPAVVDVAETVGGPWMEAMEWPLDQRKAYTGDMIYKAANGEWDPIKDGGPTSDWLATIIGMDPTKLGLPTGTWTPLDAVNTPEKQAEAKKVYETAEAQGQDGGRAVWEWYIGQFGLGQRGLTDALGDPMNLTMLGTGAGEALLATRLAEEGTATARAIRAAAAALKLPDQIGNLPFEGPAAIFRTAAKWSGRQGALERALVKATEAGPFKSSEDQIAREIAQQTDDALTTATEIYERYGPDGQFIGPMPLENGPAVPTPGAAAVPTPGTGAVPTAPGVGPVPINEAPGTIPPASVVPPPEAPLTNDEIVARMNWLRGEGVGPAPLDYGAASPTPQEIITPSTVPGGGIGTRRDGGAGWGVGRPEVGPGPVTPAEITPPPAEVVPPATTTVPPTAPVINGAVPPPPATNGAIPPVTNGAAPLNGAVIPPATTAPAPTRPPLFRRSDTFPDGSPRTYGAATDQELAERLAGTTEFYNQTDSAAASDSASRMIREIQQEIDYRASLAAPATNGAVPPATVAPTNGAAPTSAPVADSGSGTAWSGMDDGALRVMASGNVSGLSDEQVAALTEEIRYRMSSNVSVQKPTAQPDASYLSLTGQPVEMPNWDPYTSSPYNPGPIKDLVDTARTAGINIRETDLYLRDPVTGRHRAMAPEEVKGYIAYLAGMQKKENPFPGASPLEARTATTYTVPYPEYDRATNSFKPMAAYTTDPIRPRTNGAKPPLPADSVTQAVAPEAAPSNGAGPTTNVPITATVPTPVPPSRVDLEVLPTIGVQGTPAENKGWSTKTNTAAPRFQKDVVARDYPEQWAEITADGHWFKHWTINTYEPTRVKLQNGKLRTTDVGIRGTDAVVGNNRSLLPMLDREFHIKMKAALRQASPSVDTSDMRFISEERLVTAIGDPELVRAGHAGTLGGTYKIAREPGKPSSKESWVDLFLSTPDEAEAARIEALMLTSPKAPPNEEVDNLYGYWRKTAPTNDQSRTYRRDMAAYERYVDMHNARVMNQMPDEQIDQLLGIEKPPRAVDPADTETLPTVDQLNQRQSTWTASAVDHVNSLPTEEQAEIYSNIGDWWNDVYEHGVENGTPRTKTLADLELGARLRNQASAAGATIPDTPMTFPDTPEGRIQGAVLDPDDARSMAYLNQLEAEGVIYREVPPADPDLDPELFAQQHTGYETYQSIQNVRGLVHGDALPTTANGAPNLTLNRNEFIPHVGSSRVGWEVKADNGFTRRFKTRRAAQEFIDDVNANGGTVEPWILDIESPGATGRYPDYYAYNTITGERIELPRKRTSANTELDRLNADSGRVPIGAYVSPTAPTPSAAPISATTAVPTTTTPPIPASTTPSAPVTRTSPPPATPTPTTTGTAAATPTVTSTTPAPPTRQRVQRMHTESERYQQEWANDPTWGVETGGDGVIAAAYADGALTKDEVIALRSAITIQTGTKTRTTTIMDLITEQILDENNATIQDAKRAAGAIIAKSRMKPPKGKIGKFWQSYDKVTSLYREMYMYNPTSAAKGAFADGSTNSLIVGLEGHRKVGFQNINPVTNLAMFWHNLTGRDMVTPAMKISERWGVKPGHTVYITGRDVTEGGTENLAWEELRGIGKGIKKSRVMDVGRAWRQTNDRLVRGNLWTDEFQRELKRVLNGTSENTLTGQIDRESFYAKVIGIMGGGPEADRAVAELKKLADSGAGFLPSDVKRITGSSKAMHEWRETVTSVAKAADAEVDRIFFSYRQTNLDSKVRRIFMFHYWMSRAMIQHTRLAVSNPMLLYREVRLWQALDREAHRQGLDGPMAPLQMYFEYMKGDGGMYGISNPIAAITPYAMFADVFAQSFGDETTFDKWLRRSGGFVLPQVQAAAVVLGMSNRFPDVLGTATLRSTVRALLDWDRNNGYDIFNQGPGITGDPVQHFMNVVLERANALARQVYPELNDVATPQLTKTKQDAVADLIIENAEADFGVPYKDMTDQQKLIVNDAIWAVRMHKRDNERANEALADFSGPTAGAAILNMFVPGGMRARSEYRTDTSRLTSNYYDMKDKQADYQPTEEEANALAASGTVNQGSEEAAALDLANDSLDFHKPLQPLAPGASQAQVKAYHETMEYNAKIDREETVYNGWNTIAFGQLDPRSVQVIGGKTYLGYEVNMMSRENRMKLADAWVLDNGAAADLKSYRARRDAVIDSNPDLAGYKDWQKTAREYNGGEVWRPNAHTRVMEYQSGGMRAYRTDLEKVSPQFHQMIEIERQRLQENGVTGDELEKRLDMWANSTEGYNAYRGVKDNINDPALKPTNDPSKALPVLPGTATTEETTGTGSSKSTKKDDGPPKPAAYTGYTGKWDDDNNRPAYQTALINDLNTYQQELDAFEAEYGPIENLSWSISQNPTAWKRILPKPPENLESYLAWARKQQEAGADASMEAYIKMRDSKYAADHADTEDEDEDVIDTTPEYEFVPAWQQASP